MTGAGTEPAVHAMNESETRVERYRDAHRRVLERIATACARDGREPDAVTLVAVSKTVAADALRDAELLANAAASGTVSSFADYGATRDVLSQPLFEVTDAIASFAWDLDQLKVLHRMLNSAMKHEIEHILTLDDAHSWRPRTTPPIIMEDAA